jgi:hypothetical protein
VAKRKRLECGEPRNKEIHFNNVHIPFKPHLHLHIFRILMQMKRNRARMCLWTFNCLCKWHTASGARKCCLMKVKVKGHYQDYNLDDVIIYQTAAAYLFQITSKVTISAEVIRIRNDSETKSGHLWHKKFSNEPASHFVSLSTINEFVVMWHDSCQVNISLAQWIQIYNLCFIS